MKSWLIQKASADRYSVCPKCGKPPDSREKLLRAHLDSMYGKIPIAEYEAGLSELASVEDSEPEETLREDWELYWESPGVLKLIYSCNCGSCDFHASWSQRKVLFKKS